MAPSAVLGEHMHMAGGWGWLGYSLHSRRPEFKGSLPLQGFFKDTGESAGSLLTFVSDESHIGEGPAGTGGKGDSARLHECLRGWASWS